MDQTSSFNILSTPLSLQFGSNDVPFESGKAVLFNDYSTLLVSRENLELLRFVVGLIGNAVSILLYAAPILTFKRVIENKSTGEFSCIPYVMALLNCIIYTWYGSPLVSHKWENLPLVTINGFGIFLELSFILIYFWFASSRGKKLVSLIMAPVVLAICVLLVVLTFELSDRGLRKAAVGSIGLVFSAAMYGSPLVVMKRVIRTKSVEYMPFHLSLFSFLSSSLWLAYGLLSNDLLLASPCLIGCPLGIIQLVVYCLYRGQTEILEDPIKIDIESSGGSLLITAPLIESDGGSFLITTPLISDIDLAIDIDLDDDTDIDDNY